MASFTKAGFFAAGLVFPLLACGAPRTARMETFRRPLVFEPGPLPDQFIARTGPYAVSINSSAVEIRGRAQATLRMVWQAANAGARAHGLQPTGGHSFYYLGNDPHRWRTNLPIYSRVAVQQLYPGIDLVFYGNGSELEYDLLVSPGADPRLIHLSFQGRPKLTLDTSGDLIADAAIGSIRLKRPAIYQELGGARHTIAGGYHLQRNLVTFTVDRYDPAHPLVIDPSVVYSTYLGGTGDDDPYDLKVDAAGNIYITGSTDSTNFPGAPKSGSGSFAGDYDIFLLKLDPTGKTILYSVLIGGSDDDEPAALAVDASGYAYVTGYTLSTNFPTVSAYQTSLRGWSDVFVARLDANGSLQYSTYLGGATARTGAIPLGDQYANAITVDTAGNAYVTGDDGTTDFPVTTPITARVTQNYDAFVAKFGPTGKLLFSTVIGGSAWDGGEAIAVSSGLIYVAGDSMSSDLPTTAGALQPSFKGAGTHHDGDVWIARIDPSSATNYLTALTYFGGSSDDDVLAVILDASGNVYLSGETWSLDFPVTAGALQTTYGGAGSTYGWGDAWFAKLNPLLTQRIFVSYFGSKDDDSAAYVLLDTAGNLYLAGGTTSTTLLPATTSTINVTLPTGTQQITGYILKLKSDGSGIVNSWSGKILWPGSLGASGAGSMDRNATSFYIAVGTSVKGLPVSAASLQNAGAGGDDIFLAHLSLYDNPVVVTSVNVVSGGADIAQNTWIEIHGAGLAPASVGAGMTWSSAPDFASGRMPTQLQGVSATVNGKPAYIYFISPTQVNVLTPLDSTTGPVQLKLTNGSNTSDPFTVNMKTVAPTFLMFGAGPYVTSVHANASLVGPTSMSVPGYPFTPVQLNEQFLVFGTGFGLPATTLTDGSAAQVGALQTFPQITIGNAQATVAWAGVISPGLYQFNVIVPQSALNGDNAIQATYAGATSLAGTLVTVAK